MKVYTSYFEKAEAIPKDWNIFIVGSDAPNGFTFPHMDARAFAPSWGLMNDYLSEAIEREEFAIQYVNDLIKKFESSDRIKEFILNLAVKDKPIVLVTKVPSKNNCHRNILARYVFGSDYMGELECDKATLR